MSLFLNFELIHFAITSWKAKSMVSPDSISPVLGVQVISQYCVFLHRFGGFNWASMLVWQALTISHPKVLLPPLSISTLSLSMPYQVLCASGFCDTSRIILESPSFSIGLCTAKSFYMSYFLKTCSKVVVICFSFRIYINFHIFCSFGTF